MNTSEILQCRCGDCSEAVRKQCNSARVRELVTWVLDESVEVDSLPVLFCRRGNKVPSGNIFPNNKCLCVDCELSPGGVLFCESAELK